MKPNKVKALRDAREALERAALIAIAALERSHHVSDRELFEAADGLRAALAHQAEQQGELWCHVRSGGVYERLGTGLIQSEEPLRDMEAVVIYRGADGNLWARREDEFNDGRFVPIQQGD